jgi:ABC-type glutathione transport system ATPase component
MKGGLVMLIDEPTTILDGTTVLGVIIFQRGCCMV